MLALLQQPLVQQLGQTTLGTAVAYKVAKGGLKRGSLNRDGAIAAFTVAALAFSCSFRSGITLLCFYKTGSMLTKYGAAVKQKLEEDYVAGEGQRGAGQVLACSAIAVACAILRRVFVGTDGPLSLGVGELECLGNRLTLAFVAFFGCCAGDTYASELGILSKSPPRLVTKPWKVAKPGTNGGISALGTAASAGGGIAMGLCHGLFMFPPSLREAAALAYVGLLAGAGGSLVDSLLGATVQASYFCSEKQKIVKRPTATTTHVSGLPVLSNEMVNFVSTALVAWAAYAAPRRLLLRFSAPLRFAT
jgi:uncharacterized protein (TIGR00297 family)